MSPESISQKLVRIKENIDAKVTESNQLDGQIAAQLAQLKKEFGYESEEAASKSLTEMQKEIERLDTQLEKDVTDFEKKYGISK